MIFERRLLFEADGDEDTSATADTTNDTAENNDTSANDNNDTQEDNNQTEDNNEDQNTDDNQEDDNNDDQNNDDNNDEDNQDDNDDFSIGDDDNSDDNNNDDNNGDFTGGDSSDENKPESDELKAKDRELFDSLSLAEQQIKIRELKENFSELYNNCMTLIDRYNELSIESDDNMIYINRINSCLIDLKGMISFYILNLYDLKSYFENDIMFNRYLAVCNSIKNTTNIIKNNTVDQNEDKKGE